MKKVDIFLFIIITILTLFGLLMIYDASSVIAFRDFGDKYHYIRDQFAWAVLGFFALFVFSVIDYHKLYNLSLMLLVVSIILLLLVFIPGIGVFALGAYRWINLRVFILQPAEFIKLCLAIYLAAWFSHKEKGRFLAFCLLVGMVLLLVMFEPDMGTASIILSEAILIYFLSGGSIMHFVYAAPLLFLGGFFIIKLEPYRVARLTSFLRLGRTLNGASYHVKQILIALGSGGLLGVGIGNSMQKYAYLPENVTDSIFPIIAEEFGFLGGFLLIFLFSLFLWRGFLIASHAKDNFGKLLAGGIMAFLGIQMIINLGAMTALFPLTGVPLPFISYGGSALIVDLASVGILLNISKQSINR